MIYPLVDLESTPLGSSFAESGVKMEGSMSGTQRNCVSCGRAISFDANVCPYCGHDYRVAAYAAPAVAKKSALPVAGGVLVLIAGLLALVMGGLYLALDIDDLDDAGVTLPPEMTLEELQDIITMCGALCIIFGIIAILGGVFSLQRKHFALAIVGAIFGLLGIGFFLGSLLALIGLILIAMSRHEFT
jgi:amino acid transporter